MKPSRHPLGSGRAVAVAIFLSLSLPNARAADFLRDLDGDGEPERIVRVGEREEIQCRDKASSAWTKADFALPDGVTLNDAQGQDAGLRFVDLNGDGHDDVLFANADRFALHLWTKNVQPHLGWTRGWSQFVRAGQRTGAAHEPPSLVGATVTLRDGEVEISRPAEGNRPAAATRIAAKRLIAFDMPPPQSPAEALASFRVRAGFRVELVAAEPVVVDPVAFDWDAAGRLWVVEMRDYPLGLDGRGRPGGVVKVLADDDGDGRCEHATVFLDGLPFPTSVMPWRRGALIATAPDLIYAEDTDGDGRADVRTVLFTGLTPGNQQHRFNGFEWGLDGWIYAANGDSGGKVRSLKTGREVSISGRDFRFRPGTGEVETVSAQTQFGLRRDDWGRWFGNNNATWLWHVTLPEHYLRRNPRLAVKSVRQTLANYPDSTRVFPASAPMVRPNQPWSLNHVTSGCSPTPYRDELFGPDFATSVFISEPVHNAIHREVLETAGAGLASHRAAGEETSEFLASTDNWFRPVTLRTGPDGALYVADMYRFVLEHPEWISPEMQARLELRAGEDRGRLYRIVPDGSSRRRIPDLSRLDTAGLVAALDSANGWQRDQAMRRLVDLNATAAAEPLGRLLALTHAPKVRLQALATLGLLRTLGAAQLRQALNDPHPQVRSEALRQSEAFAFNTASRAEVFPAVAALAQDGEAAVRLQAAFSLGAWPEELAEPALRRLAESDGSDELIRVAIQSSLRPDHPWFRELQSNQNRPAATAVVPALKPSSADRVAVIAGYAGVERLKGNADRGRASFQKLCAGCHRLRGEGHEVGPDLGMVATKPADWLLAAILDPNQAVEARYRAWTLSLKSGDTLSGLVTAETANNLVLRLAGGAEQAVLRSDLATLEVQPLSLMPAGFESALSPQDMADLLAWLQGK